VCGAIVTPTEGAYGNQERHPGRLLAGHDPKAVFAKDGLFDELKKALAERVLNAEIDDHLDGEANSPGVPPPPPTVRMSVCSSRCTRRSMAYRSPRRGLKVER
jgi:hypothetical protein